MCVLRASPPIPTRAPAARHRSPAHAMMWCLTLRAVTAEEMEREARAADMVGEVVERVEKWSEE